MNGSHCIILFKETKIKMKNFVTYVSKKVKGASMVEASVLFATQDLQQQYPKAKHI